MNQLLEHIKNYVRAYPDSDLNQFVRYINISWEVNDISVEPTWSNDTLNGVQIMTVHQSKGKEFSHVIIPFLVSGGFPLNYQNKALIQFLPAHWRNWEVGDRSMKDLHIEEERRIFYVAITRAENSLILMTTEKRQSQFIKDISSEFLKREKIMTESIEVKQIDTLISRFENKLLDAITFEKWDEIPVEERTRRRKMKRRVINNGSPTCRQRSRQDLDLHHRGLVLRTVHRDIAAVILV